MWRSDWTVRGHSSSEAKFNDETASILYTYWLHDADLQEHGDKASSTEHAATGRQQHGRGTFTI